MVLEEIVWVKFVLSNIFMQLFKDFFQNFS